jgi:hypothetical protein
MVRDQLDTLFEFIREVSFKIFTVCNSLHGVSGKLLNKGVIRSLTL